VYAVWLADVIGRPLAVVGGAAVLALAAGLVGRWGPLVQVAVSLAIAAYGAALFERDEFDPLAPLVAAALVAAAELAYTSIEPPARRVWPFELVVVAGGAGVAALMLAVAGVGGGGVRDHVLGVVAAAAAIAVLARLAATARG
jgi:hypothetical protein